MSEAQTDKVPVVELFGPTIQGEGIMTGTISHFLRTGGCPLRCSWCDSMYAVEPDQVKANTIWLSTADILQMAAKLPRAPYITFTGGDPCMWEELGSLITPFNAQGMRVAVETQGTLFPSWLPEADVLTFSPKGPSSGNIVDAEDLMLWLIDNAMPPRKFKVCIKVVIFGAEDMQYGLNLLGKLPTVTYDAFYLSAGTTLAEKPVERIAGVLSNLQSLANKLLEMVPQEDILVTEKLHIGAQLHVLLWPHKNKGV